MAKSAGMRTGKGTVTAKARKKSGMKGGGKKGKFPIFDQKSCLAAVRLRHHGKGVSAAAVLAKASRWANTNNCGPCKAAIKRAHAADRQRKTGMKSK